MEIAKDYLTETCKIGQGNACCRYVIVHPDDGIICAKEQPNMKAALDMRVKKMTAQGDNCIGWDSYLKTLDS